MTRQNLPEQLARRCMISIGKAHDVIIRTIAAMAIVIIFQGAASANLSDSTKATLFINPRLHSAGYFPFTGALLNHDPVADVNIFYEKKMFGFFIFQSVDLVDRHSYVNYLQPGIFATFRVQPNLRVRTFFGYIFNQTRGFKDSDSDYYTAANLSWDFAPHFRLDNTLLFYDITIQKKLANRLLVSWSFPKFKTDLYLWHRTVLEENKSAISASLALTWPIIKLSEKTSFQFTSAYLRYLTEYRPGYALADGFIFTIAVPVNILPKPHG